MKLTDKTVSILLRLLDGESIPASLAQGKLFHELITERIVWQKGKHRKTLHLTNKHALTDYLYIRYGIRDVAQYRLAATRSEHVMVGSDSKNSNERVFKGFLVNCYKPVTAQLNGEVILIDPTHGSFVFIYDFETFKVSEETTIVGVENAMNFRFIQEQAYLFEGITPLFISRYPQNQSKDFIDWIKSVRNNYLHFGDFDMAGIGIYLNEYKKHLGERARFFIPINIESSIREYGNSERFDIQKINFNMSEIEEQELIQLIEIIKREKKGLDQEFFIKKKSSDSNSSIS